MNLGKLGQAITAKEIFDLIHDDLDRVEKEISLETVASVDVVTSIGQYLQESGGKRLRPALLLLASKLVGEGGKSAIRLGAVVEIIHAATLVHDDVIDDARTRRGRPSTNVQCGNHTSVLAGDWLYMQATCPTSARWMSGRLPRPSWTRPLRGLAPGIGWRSGLPAL